METETTNLRLVGESPSCDLDLSGDSSSIDLIRRQAQQQQVTTFDQSPMDEDDVDDGMEVYLEINIYKREYYPCIQALKLL